MISTIHPVVDNSQSAALPTTFGRPSDLSKPPERGTKSPASGFANRDACRSWYWSSPKYSSRYRSKGGVSMKTMARTVRHWRIGGQVTFARPRNQRRSRPSHNPRSNEPRINPESQLQTGAFCRAMRIRRCTATCPGLPAHMDANRRIRRALSAATESAKRV